MIVLICPLQQPCFGPDGAPGYQHALNLAEKLVQLRHVGRVTVPLEKEIMDFWENPPLERDEGPVDYQPRYRDSRSQGRFKKAQSSHAATDVTVGVESMRR